MASTLSKILVNKQNSGFKAVENRFINTNSSKFDTDLKLTKFVVFAKIENPETGYRYAISALLNNQTPKRYDVYIDKYPISDPTQRTHYLSPITGCRSGEIKRVNNGGTIVTLIVDWKDVENADWSWYSIWLDFSDYTYTNQENAFIAETYPTDNGYKIPYSSGVFLSLNRLYFFNRMLKEMSHMIIDWEQPYSSSDNYSCYITRVFMRSSVIGNSNLSELNLPTTESPKGEESIQIPNGHSLVYDLSDSTYKIINSGSFDYSQLILFSNYMGEGRKADFDSADQRILMRYINANLSEKQLSNTKSFADELYAVRSSFRTAMKTCPETSFYKFHGYLTNGGFYHLNISDDLDGLVTPIISVVPGETIYYKGNGEYGAQSYIFQLDDESIVCGQISNTEKFTPIIVPNNAVFGQFASYGGIGRCVLELKFNEGDITIDDVKNCFEINNIPKQLFNNNYSCTYCWGIPIGDDPITSFDQLQYGSSASKRGDEYLDTHHMIATLKPNTEYWLSQVSNISRLQESWICVRQGSANYYKYPVMADGSGRRYIATAYTDRMLASDRVSEDLKTQIRELLAAGLCADIYSDINSSRVQPIKHFITNSDETELRIQLVFGRTDTPTQAEIENWKTAFVLSEVGPVTQWVPESTILKDEANSPAVQQLLNDKPWQVESAGNKSHIDIKSSDKVGFFSNSFLEGYAMLGHHAIEKMMAFSDYIAYNYSQSGNDMIEECYRLDKDNAFLGPCRPSEIGVLKWGIIMHQDNDGIVFSANHRSYYENAKKLGYEIMALGGQPILSTEHDWAAEYNIFQRLCQDEGWRFANWGKVYNDIQIGQYRPMWHSGHPATRSNWSQVHGYLPIIEALPRPVQSLKLFRLRSAVDATDLKNMLYNTILERAERWAELHNGQTCIKQGQEARFDRWGNGGYSDGNYDTQSFQCEYQKLIKHTSISFGNHLLADITTPYNVRSITTFDLTIIGTGISKVYARQIRYMDDSWLPQLSSRYITFGVVSGLNLLHVGDTITISGITRQDGTDLNKTYTISGITNEYIVTSELQGNHVTSGTDTPTCGISGVTLSGTYGFPSANYLNNYNKPLGQWTEVTTEAVTGGLKVSLTTAQIEKFGAADKFVFMATGSDIAITDIFADVVGSNLKERHEKSIIIPEPKEGQSALSTTTFTTTDTAWENLANIPTVTPVTDGTYTEQLPGTVREIPTNGWLAQQIDTTKLAVNRYKKPLRIQIQVLARWFPKYILTDSEYTTSELTTDSFDMAKLEVQLNYSANPSENVQFPVTTMYIGAWWNVYVFEMDLVGTPSWLTLKCVDKRVQIAKCDLVVIE